jgi:hypothetical protein
MQTTPSAQCGQRSAVSGRFTQAAGRAEIGDFELQSALPMRAKRTPNVFLECDQTRVAFSC